MPPRALPEPPRPAERRPCELPERATLCNYTSPHYAEALITVSGCHLILVISGAV